MRKIHGLSPKNSPSMGLFYDDIRAVTTTADGAVWVGGYASEGSPGQIRWPVVDAAVARFDGHSWGHWHFKDDGYVSALAVDAEGRPWLGTSRDGRTAADVNPQSAYYPEAGVRVFTSGVWWTLNTENSGLVGDDIRAIGTPPTGERWFGTYRSGLSVMTGGEFPVLDRHVYLPLTIRSEGPGRITSSRLGDSPGSATRTQFPSSTSALYAALDYANYSGGMMIHRMR